MEIVWKDFHLRRILLFFLSIITISFIAYNYLYRQLKWNEALLSIFILLFFIYILINIAMTKLTYVTKNGIRIGNILDDNYERIKSLKKTMFLDWVDIKEIKVYGKVTHRIWIEVLVDFLVIKTKPGKKYESFIANPKGFLKAIKRLNKGKLVSKDSKYYELIKNI